MDGVTLSLPFLSGLLVFRFGWQSFTNSEAPLRKGKLRGFKVGQQVRIPRAAIAEYERQGEPCEQGSTEDTGAPSGPRTATPDKRHTCPVP